MFSPTEPEELFKHLYNKAEEAATELSRPWFDKGLFSCRSTMIADYVKEAESTWLRCQQLATTENTAPTANREQYNWLIERLDKQLSTLVQALYRGKPAKRAAVSSVPTHAQQQKQTQDLLGLYQQLKTYKEYEVRLGDNLRVVQLHLTALSQSNSRTNKSINEQQNAQQQLLVAQQRLQRCQKAIAAVERAIAKLEG